jgi:predicted RNase H-like HicB family nuclease
MRVKTLYAVIKAGNCWNASAPDYPGCLATGKTAREAKENLIDALRLHIEGMLEDGDSLPEEDFDGGFIEVDVPDTLGNATGGAERLSGGSRPSRNAKTVARRPAPLAH